MKLIIHLKKGSTKPSTLTCQRDDGSTTYSKLVENFEIHDIAHYVVEQNLGFKNAFYGLLAQGYDIGDFQLPKNERPFALLPKNLHPEALFTEHLVNLLLIDSIQVAPKNDILNILKKILSENNLPFMAVLTSEKLSKIKDGLERQMTQWNRLLPNKKLELIFEL
jgi:hypothetical protein